MNAALAVILLFIAIAIACIPGVAFWFWAREHDLGIVALPAIVTLAAIIAGVAQRTADLSTSDSVGVGILAATAYAVVTLVVAAEVDA